MKFSSASSLVLLGASSSRVYAYKRQAPVEIVENFDWKDPFQSEAISSFEPACESKASFDVLEYTLHDLMEPYPSGLKPWANGLREVFSDREYPGSWAGLDRHLHDRSLLLMGYEKIPLVVREWIEEQERSDGQGKALFAVFEKPKKDKDEVTSVVEFPSAEKIDRSQDEKKVAIFAPGALYGILPLWSAEGSNCKDTLLDLAKYKATPEDGGVVGWIAHSSPQGKKSQLEVKVQVLKAKLPQETGSKDEL
ncbi:hypothetical protein BGZ63DRAFT_384598 [Mariannaea sp. PMI_226]|nr:hypothetical protein BGZ63DRAFT_384598 [Mariannaea sp. PMI_226]